MHCYEMQLLELFPHDTGQSVFTAHKHLNFSASDKTMKHNKKKLKKVEAQVKKAIDQEKYLVIVVEVAVVPMMK